MHQILLEGLTFKSRKMKPKTLYLIFSSLLCFSGIYAQEQDTSSFELPVKLCKQPIPSKVDYPKNDSLIYDQFVGETIAGFRLASGWRSDTMNGGYNKILYSNPYLEVLALDKFEKKDHLGNFQYFRYEKGKRFTGWINDTLVSHYTSEKLLFHAWCANGMVQGKAIITAILTGEVVAEAQFKNGELAGKCINRKRTKKTEQKVKYSIGSGVAIKQ